MFKSCCICYWKIIEDWKQQTHPVDGIIVLNASAKAQC